MSSAISPSADLARVAERIREGDPSAEEELVREFGDRVRVFAGMRTRDRETARDLGQEVMMNVLTALRRGQLRDPDRLAAFVYGTARNVVNNYLRTGGQERSDPLPDLAAVTADPVDELEAGRRQSLVRRALARLSRDDRGILLLTLVDGLKPVEIAYKLGLTAEVVRARKSRALKKVVVRIDELSRKRSWRHMVSRRTF
jgi:RNA polymerase sigma-70 factor (ECF subfamily)